MMEMSEREYYSYLRSRKKKPMTAKRARTAKMNRELAKKKREMWDRCAFMPECAICGDGIEEFSDCEIDHINPRKMGGGARDDSDSNLQLTHYACNREKGSKRETL